VVVACALLSVWLIADVRTPDMAAQAYRAALFGQLGFAVFDARWYAGHELLGYSLLFPPLGSLLGLRALACLSLLASVALFERLAVDAYGARPARWGAACFALAAVGDVWSGRLTFALGVAFALGAALAFARAHPVAAALLAALCAAASPVAGLLLALAGLTESLWARHARGLLVLAGPAAGVALATGLLFGDGGAEPYPVRSLVATLLAVGLFLLVLPAGERLLRTGALAYLAACLACLAVPSPMGSNVERYGVLLAGPLLVCALLRARAGDGGGGAATAHAARAAGTAGPRAPALAALALALIGAWVVWGPVRETLAVAGDRSTRAAYYAPVDRFLAAHASGPVRVEVPLTRSHWEAALLAPSFSLARGWEKQLEERYDGVLLRAGLTAAAYERWLREQAVDYVALPDAPLDPSSAREGRLIAGGLPFLREQWAGRHWRIYAVAAPTPLLSGPGRLVALGHDSATLQARGAGGFLLRVHFTRFWTVARGQACVEPAPGGWTAIEARAPGTVQLAARFSLGRALGLGSSSSCRAGRAR
jgi:hypothetical protein